MKTCNICYAVLRSTATHCYACGAIPVVVDGHRKHYDRAMARPVEFVRARGLVGMEYSDMLGSSLLTQLSGGQVTVRPPHE